MSILVAIFGWILQSLGRILAFLFGWAIIGFFGQLPPKQQYILSAMALLSLLWWFLLASYFVPILITVLVSIQPQVARQTGLIVWFTWPGVLLIPPLVGLLSLSVSPERPQSLGAKARQVLTGYLVAPGFGLAMLMMMVISAWLFVSRLLLRLKVEHVPCQIKEGGYAAVLRDLESALDRAGVAVTNRPLPVLLRPPEWVLSKMASTVFCGLAPDEPRMLVGDRDQLRVILHNMDIAITARSDTAVYVRTMLTTNVPFTQAYLTWDKNAQQIEEAVYNIWQRYRGESVEQTGQALHEIAQLKQHLYVKGVPYEQWSVLYREVLQLEEALVVTPVQRAGAAAVAQAVAAREKAVHPRAHGIPHLLRSVIALYRAAAALASGLR